MSAVKVVVIAGWERSGSTILANVLGSAAGVVTLGEINNIWERGFGADLICACGRPFSRCELWRPIAEEAFGAGVSSVAQRAAAAALGNTWLMRRRLPLLCRGQEDRALPYAELLAPLYRSAAQITGAQLLVDASKSPWHAAVAFDLAGLDVYVIHLVRDPRGVAYSLQKKVRYDADDTKSIYMDQHGVTKSSLAWLYRSRLIESTWKGEDRALLLRYEDFVASPQDVTELIYSWVGLPGTHAPFTAPDQVQLRLSHNVSGNPVRFQQGTVELKADDAWRSGLPQNTARYVRALTWPHMRHFGYNR